jgi:hypothetical protein
MKMKLMNKVVAAIAVAASIGSASAVETACYSASISLSRTLTVKLTSYPPTREVPEVMPYTVMQVRIDTKGKIFSNVSFAWEEYAAAEDYAARDGEDVPEPKESLLAGKIISYAVEDDGGHAVIQYPGKQTSSLRIQAVSEYPMVLRRNVPGCDPYEDRTYDATKCETRLEPVWKTLRKVRCH